MSCLKLERWTLFSAFIKEHKKKFIWHSQYYDRWQWDIRLTHWGRVTHMYVSKLTSIGSNSGLSSGRRQTIISTSAGIVLIGPNLSQWNFDQNTQIFIHENSSKLIVCESAGIVFRGMSYHEWYWYILLEIFHFPDIKSLVSYEFDTILVDLVAWNIFYLRKNAC